MKTLIILIALISLQSCRDGYLGNNEVAEKTVMFTKKNAESYVISSPMKGILIHNRVPLINTKIIRKLKWNGNEAGLVETFTTDENGRFFLPVHEEELSLGMLNQFVSSTEVEVDLDGKIFEVWYNNKFENGLFVETDGEIKELVCDLMAEELILKAGLSKILTICRWKDMPVQDM